MKSERLVAHLEFARRLKNCWCVWGAVLYTCICAITQFYNFTLPQFHIAGIAGVLIPFLSIVATIPALRNSARREEELLLTAAVRERSIAVGRTIGVAVWICIVITVACSIYSVVNFLFTSSFNFQFPIFTMLVWGATCTAVALACAVAGGIAAVMFAGLMFIACGFACDNISILRYIENPVFSFASATVITLLALFIHTKVLATRRMIGHSARGLRISTRLAQGLACVFTLLILAHLAMPLPIQLQQQFEGLFAKTENAERRPLHFLTGMRSIHLRLTAFINHNDPQYANAVKLVNTLERELRAVAPLSHLEISFVDERLDFTAATKLARRGIKPPSLIFERERRNIVVPMADADMNACTRVLRSLCRPNAARSIYFMAGHGESSCKDYNALTGLSDLARALAQEGFSCHELSDGSTIPNDCAVLIAPGVKTAYSANEDKAVIDYLKHGGRMLMFLTDGCEKFLQQWMLSAEREATPLEREVNSDAVICSLAEHPINEALMRCNVIMSSNPFSLSFRGVEGNAVDRLTFTPLVSLTVKNEREKSKTAATQVAVAALVERGGKVSQTLSVKPMRIVIVGDEAFPLNGMLKKHGNANLEFLLNAVSFLTGIELPKGTNVIPPPTPRNQARKLCMWTILATLIIGSIHALLIRKQS